MNDKCADRTSDKASNTSDCATKLLISGLLKKSFIVLAECERQREAQDGARKSDRKAESLIRENLGGRCCVDITRSPSH